MCFLSNLAAIGLGWAVTSYLVAKSLNYGTYQGHASVLSMDWYGNGTLHNTPFTNITIGGTPVAAVQNVDNFSFA
jgi:hypothetical protein